MTRDAVLQGFSHFNIKPNLLLLMVTNVSWHTSKCWLINLLVRAKIHLYNYVIFFSNFHLQFHLGKKIHKLLFFLFFPSLQKKKKRQLSGVAVKQRRIGSSFVFSTCFLNTDFKLYLLALLSLILYLIPEFFLIIIGVLILHPWLSQSVRPE